MRDYSANTVKIWERWISLGTNETSTARAGNTVNVKRGAYVDNMYLRLFTGPIGCLRAGRKDFFYDGLHKSRPLDHINNTGCPLYSHGCNLKLGEVNHTDVLLAQKVLGEFNVILITEFLGDPEYLSYLKHLLGVQDFHPPLVMETVGRTPKTQRSDSPITPALVLDKLTFENRFDSALYDRLKGQAKEALRLAASREPERRGQWKET